MREKWSKINGFWVIHAQMIKFYDPSAALGTFASLQHARLIKKGNKVNHGEHGGHGDYGDLKVKKGV